MRAKEKYYPEKPLFDELAEVCKIADGRRKQGTRYQMVTVVILLVIGYMMGETTYRGIDRLIHGTKKANESMGSKTTEEEICTILEPFLDVSHGLPRHYVFSRVLSKADPIELTCTVADFFYQLIPHDENLPLPHFCIDGKAVRAAENRALTGKSLYIVNVMNAAYKILLYHMKVGPKTQESKSIEAEISDILFGAAAIVTMDALSTRKELLKRIVEAGSEAVLPVKSNNRNLEDLLRTYLIRNAQESPEKLKSFLDLGHYSAESKPSKILSDVRCNWFEEDNRTEEENPEEMSMDSFAFFEKIYSYPAIDSLPNASPINLETDAENSNLVACIVNGRLVTLAGGHGRYERREYEVLSDEMALDLLKDNPIMDDWEYVKQVGMVTRYRITACRDKETKSLYYSLSITRTPYISTIVQSISDFSNTIREHWIVESFHNTMDKVFKEDHCTTRAQYGAENCSLMKKIAYNLIEIRRAQEALKGNDLTLTETMALFSKKDIAHNVTVIRNMFVRRICSPYYNKQT